jgi:hypothetical protein
MSKPDKTTATFRTKNRALVERAKAILQAEHPMTLRQLFYRLVSAGALGNARKDYTRLGSVTTRLREAGDVPMHWIVDHVRSTLKPSSWSGLGSFVERWRNAYRKDFWASLPCCVEVLVEKDAIAGSIQPVTEEYDIRLRVCRGYSSVSFAAEIAGLWERVRKPIHAYYLGDFDPSGFDLERDLKAKLGRYSGKLIGGRDDGAPVSWTRLAIAEEDFAAFDLVRLPVKQADRRARAFIQAHGDDCAEVDALPPDELRNRVEEAICSHIDPDRWERLQEIERLEQESLDAFVAGWDQGES